MDREVLQAGRYPRAAFVDAFYHVVWMRGVFEVPADAAYAGFRKAVDAVLGAPERYGASCNRDGAVTCDLCLAGAEVRVCGVNVRGGQCERRVRALVDTLFFETAWTGPMAPCALRCHRIVTSADRWETMENAMLGETWVGRDSTDIAENDPDWLEIVVEDERLSAADAVLTRNAAVLTAAVVLLCRVVAPDAAVARQLYIDVREALRTLTFRSDQARTIYEAIGATLFPQAREHTVAPHLEEHMGKFLDFMVRRADMATTDAALCSLAALRPDKNAQVVCALTRDHALELHRSPQFGNHVEVRWPASALTWLECRMTLHTWTRVLRLVDGAHVLAKPTQDSGVAIVLREVDFMRLLRHAPAALHCGHVVSLRMPVYKMLCQNYVQLNMDADAAAARLFVESYVALVADCVPRGLLPAVHTDLGLLHCILAVFGDTLVLHATRPYMDVQDLSVSCTVRHPTAPFEKNMAPLFGNMTGLESRVDGFQWTSETIYGFLLGFFYMGEPHVITTEAVRAIHHVLAANVTEQRNYTAAMQLVADLCTRLGAPVRIDGRDYVDVPVRMGRMFPTNTAPVACLYGLLTSALFERKQAAKLLLSIRLCPFKSAVVPHPAPLRPAAARETGVAGLHALHREYATRVPQTPYAALYSPPRVAELGCMVYFTFLLEMLAYVQADTLAHDNLAQCQREFGRFGTLPHAPLAPDAYRGTVTAHHIVRYARRDTSHDPAVTAHAYELERGVFQHQVVPTVRVACGATDTARSSAYLAADPFMRECMMLLPICEARFQMPRWQAKRKLDELVNMRLAADPGIRKRMYNPNPPAGFNQRELN